MGGIFPRTLHLTYSHSVMSLCIDLLSNVFIFKITDRLFPGFLAMKHLGYQIQIIEQVSIIYVLSINVNCFSIHRQYINNDCFLKITYVFIENSAADSLPHFRANQIKYVVTGY